MKISKIFICAILCAFVYNAEGFGTNPYAEVASRAFNEFVNEMQGQFKNQTETVELLEKLRVVWNPAFFSVTKEHFRMLTDLVSPDRPLLPETGYAEDCPASKSQLPPHFRAELEQAELYGKGREWWRWFCSPSIGNPWEDTCEGICNNDDLIRAQEGGGPRQIRAVGGDVRCVKSSGVMGWCYHPFGGGWEIVKPTTVDGGLPVGKGFRDPRCTDEDGVVRDECRAGEGPQEVHFDREIISPQLTMNSEIYRVDDASYGIRYIESGSGGSAGSGSKSCRYGCIYMYGHGCVCPEDNEDLFVKEGEVGEWYGLKWMDEDGDDINGYQGGYGHEPKGSCTVGVDLARGIALSVFYAFAQWIFKFLRAISFCKVVYKVKDTEALKFISDRQKAKYGFIECLSQAGEQLTKYVISATNQEINMMGVVKVITEFIQRAYAFVIPTCFPNLKASIEKLIGTESGGIKLDTYSLVRFMMDSMVSAIFGKIQSMIMDLVSAAFSGGVGIAIKAKKYLGFAWSFLSCVNGDMNALVDSGVAIGRAFITGGACPLDKVPDFIEAGIEVALCIFVKPQQMCEKAGCKNSVFSWSDANDTCRKEAFGEKDEFEFDNIKRVGI